MSEPNEGTGTPPVEPQGQPTPPAPEPAGTPAPLAAPTPPRAPRLEQDADLERVTRLYHNLTGQLTAYVEQSELYRGQLEQRLRTAEETTRALANQLSQAEARTGHLQGQVEDLPALQEQANQVGALQEQVSKLNLLMGYPEVVNRVVVREEQGAEGEEPRRVRSNPTMEILLTSTLSGEDFARHVQDFVSTLPTVQAQASGPPPETGASLTPQPAPQQGRMARYWELYNSGEYEAALDYLQESSREQE